MHCRAFNHVCCAEVYLVILFRYIVRERYVQCLEQNDDEV